MFDQHLFVLEVCPVHDLTRLGRKPERTGGGHCHAGPGGPGRSTLTRSRAPRGVPDPPGHLPDQRPTAAGLLLGSQESFTVTTVKNFHSVTVTVIVT